jgi:hypothetical protein
MIDLVHNFLPLWRELGASAPKALLSIRPWAKTY